MKNKRILASVLALVILLSSLSLGLISYAKTNYGIALDKVYTDTTEGVEDKIWYTYTPEETGTFTFISYALGLRTEAYLFTRTTNPDGSKTYNQLAYAGPSDPDYMDNRSFNYLGIDYIHTATNFILTYHLEKGVTYYFAGGLFGTASKEKVSVRLFNVEYDKEALESVTVTSPVTLSAFTGGEWRDDQQGKRYYYYNFNKVQQNMTITLKYKDGRVVTGSGTDGKIDGYSVSFNQNQAVDHWYAQDTPDYKGNYLTITVGTVSCDYDVQIKTYALYSVKGVVEDYQTGNPIQNAEITINNIPVGNTDENGAFSFNYNSGSFKMTIQYKNYIGRESTLLIDANDLSKNDHTDKPIRLVYGDYIADGVINAKDYAYSLQNELVFNREMVNFKSTDYPTIIE